MGASEPSPRPISAQRTLGRYRVERALGDPSQGRFAGRDPEGRSVTLVLFDGGDDATAFAQRLRDDPVLGKHEHPNLMPVLDVGADVASRRVFVVVPGFDGTDGHRLIAERGPIDPAAAVRIVLQAAHGLDALQAAGVRACELAPSDLFIVYGPDRSATVRVLPLGDARRQNAQSGSLSGTDVVPARSFRPPGNEDPSGPPSELASVGSLGACLYWLLSASTPAPDSSQTGSISSVQEHAPWVAPGLTINVHLALQADPAMRWPTVAAFCHALQAFSGGHDRLTRVDLAPIDKQVRRRVAERADPKALARRGDEADSNTNTASSTGLFGKLKQEPQGLDALTGQTLAGRWKILRAVGRGGMGAVFEVEGPGGKHAAVKLIDRHLVGQDEETYKRFVREAKAASSIKNPHVVQTIEAGIDPELKAPYIIMELLNGVDLKSVIREHGALQAQPVVRAILQAARGISAAHAQKIVHRDIKPANLFLHQDPDGSITVKVCDFGIAKRTDIDGDQTGSHDLTRTGGMLGSPAYMSPEQATNARNVDHRTDIWSLCISMYEALSGTKPWAGRSALGEIIVAICTQQVPPLWRVAPWVDRSLATVVHRGLRAELGDRWQTVEELIAALEPFAGGGDSLRFADFSAVTPEQRALQPSSIPPAQGDQDAATVMGGVLQNKPTQAAAATELEPPPSRRRGSGWLWVAGLAVVIAAVVVVGKSRLQSSADTTPTPTAPAPTQSATLPTTRARVKIVPPTATVTVNGSEVPVVDGAIELAGLPGTEFRVEVRDEGGAHETASVVLAREGGAVPDQVVIEPEKTGGKPTNKGRTSPKSGPGVGSARPTTEEPVKPVPSATHEPAHNPEFKNEW